MMNREKIAALALCAVISLSPFTGTAAAQASGDDVLSIAQQGIFSAGGITVTSDGTFDPEDQWEETGAGQTAHVDHANVLYQIPANETVAKAVAATIDEVYSRTGKNSILVTHSQGGGPGWTAAKYTDHIAAIVAIEPGGAPGADSEDFRAVLDKKIPVTMYFGDYIDNGDPAIQATGMWQMMRQACYAFRDAYNEQGGNCTVVDLPQEGITGNDHFMFQDLNNDVIADHVENWIQENVAQ